MDQRLEAIGFFSVIKRQSELDLDSTKSINASDNSTHHHDLYVVPYSQEYKTFLDKAAELLRKAGDMTSSPRYSSHTLNISFKFMDMWKFSVFKSILCVV